MDVGNDKSHSPFILNMTPRTTADDKMQKENVQISEWERARVAGFGDNVGLMWMSLLKDTNDLVSSHYSSGTVCTLTD